MIREQLVRLHDKMVEDIKDCSNEPAYSDFLCERHWYGNTTINIDDVNGSNHPDYANKTWNYVLENAPRMEANLKMLEQNPDYYLSTDKKQPEWAFKAVYWKGDDKVKLMYPYHNGNHRTAIAKAFLYSKGVSELHGVTLYKDVYDYELYRAANRLFEDVLSYNRKQYVTVQVVIINSSFEDELDRSVLRNELALQITNLWSNVELILNAKEIYEFIEESKINPLPLRYWFRKNRYAKFLRYL